MLKDAKSQRFVEDFLGQWLKLRSIAANDPDKKLYPEFSPYLQDSMVAETRAYFRELIDKNLDATYLVKSDFAMLNEKLATHYGIPGVTRRAGASRGAAAGLPARRIPHAGGDLESDRQRHDDLARAARRLRHGAPARPAARAAAGEHPRRRARRARRRHHPRAARETPLRRELRRLPREDRSRGLRARGVRRHRRLPHALPFAGERRPRAARQHRSVHRHLVQARPRGRRQRRAAGRPQIPGHRRAGKHPREPPASACSRTCSSSSPSTAPAATWPSATASRSPASSPARRSRAAACARSSTSSCRARFFPPDETPTV